MANTNIDSVNASGRDQEDVALSWVVADPTNGNVTSNSGRLRLLVWNSGGSTDTVHVTRTKVVDGVTLGTHDFTMAAGVYRMIGPFDPDIFSGALKYKADAATTKFIPVEM